MALKHKARKKVAIKGDEKDQEQEQEAPKLCC